MTFPESVRGWQPTWSYCKDIPTPGQSPGLPPFSLERLRTPRSLTVETEEKGEVQMLVDAVVALVQRGVTSMDPLEVFLRRRIQLSKLLTTQCGCTRASMTPLGSTRRRSPRRRWLNGYEASLATKTTLMEPEESCHLMPTMLQTRSGLIY